MLSLGVSTLTSMSTWDMNKTILAVHQRRYSLYSLVTFEASICRTMVTIPYMKPCGSSNNNLTEADRPAGSITGTMSHCGSRGRKPACIEQAELTDASCWTQIEMSCLHCRGIWEKWRLGRLQLTTWWCNPGLREASSSGISSVRVVKKPASYQN